MSNLSRSWASVGISFYGNDMEQVSPEVAIIDFLNSGEFPEDKKMMGLVMLWLKHYSKLVHIERLKNMIGDLGALELAVLGGLASKCVRSGDLRWNLIIKFVEKRNTGNIKFNNGDSESYLSIKGIDEDFQKYGLSIAQIKPDSEKKLLQRSNILNSNAWLRNRVLFGTNVRADIATLIELGLAKTGYEAAKIAYCSFNAAYRNWQSLEEVNWPNLKAG